MVSPSIGVSSMRGVAAAPGGGMVMAAGARSTRATSSRSSRKSVVFFISFLLEIK
jgi:hypothetical protein